MTFDQLRFFVVLAETMNYTRAAEILYISQPTLSRQIMLLEEELETKLFIRTYKSLTLSPAGEIFLEESRKVLLHTRRMYDRMDQFKMGAQGTLLCATLGMFYPQIQDMFREFCCANPDVRLIMKQLPTGSVKKTVQNGEGDVGICFSFELTEKNASEFEVEPLFNEDFRLIVSDTHPLANRTSVTIEELREEHLILLGNDSFPFIRKMWERLNISNVTRTAEIHDADEIQSVILNVQTGRFISVLPSPMTRGGLSGCCALEIEGLDSSFQTVMIWKRENENPTLILFQKYFRECFPR